MILKNEFLNNDFGLIQLTVIKNQVLKTSNNNYFL